MITAQDVNKLRTMTGAGIDGLQESTDGSGWRFWKKSNWNPALKKVKKFQPVAPIRMPKRDSVFIKSSDDKKEAVLIALTARPTSWLKMMSSKTLASWLSKPHLPEIGWQGRLDEWKGRGPYHYWKNHWIGRQDRREIGDQCFRSHEGWGCCSVYHAGSKLGVLVSLKALMEKMFPMPAKTWACKLRNEPRGRGWNQRG